MRTQEELGKISEQLYSLWAKNGLSFNQVVREAIDYADQHQPSPWISVEERLPKHDERVLFAMQDGEYLQVAFGMLYLGKIEIWNSDIRPTHWMPIPPIEKGGEK